MIDLEDHPFSSQNIAHELEASSKAERRWLRWCEDAERLLGHNLDGNDAEAFDPRRSGKEGYSLDEAYECFKHGESASTYVAKVKGRARYRAHQEHVAKLRARTGGEQMHPDHYDFRQAFRCDILAAMDASADKHSMPHVVEADIPELFRALDALAERLWERRCNFSN